MRRLLPVVFLTLLLSSSQTAALGQTGPLSCSPNIEISPQSQLLYLGETADVNVLVLSCGIETDQILFEVHGPHPYVKDDLETDGGYLNYTHTYQGIVPGLDMISVTVIIGNEVSRAEAEVRWDANLSGPLEEFFDSEEENLSAANSAIEAANLAVEQAIPNQSEPPQCWVDLAEAVVNGSSVLGYHSIRCNQSVGVIYVMGTLRAVASGNGTEPKYDYSTRECTGVSYCSTGTALTRFRGEWTYHAFTTGYWDKDGRRHWLGNYRSACRTIRT